MNTITPIIIPVNSGSPPEDPKCPHCDKKLPGWSEPSDVTFTDFLVGTGIVVFILAQVIGGIVGGLDGSFSSCDRFFAKRYHYIMPAYPASCISVRWLTNKERIFNESY